MVLSNGAVDPPPSRSAPCPGAMGDAEVLAAWEAAAAEPGWLRPLRFVEELRGGGPRLRDLPLGEVNRRLLDLLPHNLGGRIEGVVGCPGCGEQLGVALPVDGVLAAVPPNRDGPVRVHMAGTTVTARPVTPADLAAAAGEAGPEAARAGLLARVVLAVDPPDALTNGLPPGLDDALDEALEGADPLGSVSVRLHCPACGAGSEAMLDVAEWVWLGASARVLRVVDEVHRLARTYGWTEDAVLALGPRRRALYLELVP